MKAVLLLIVLLAAGCASTGKPSIVGLIDEMAGNCKNGPQKQLAKPSGSANEEIQAEVEVDCAPPTPPNSCGI